MSYKDEHSPWEPGYQVFSSRPELAVVAKYVGHQLPEIPPNILSFASKVSGIIANKAIWRLIADREGQS